MNAAPPHDVTVATATIAPSTAIAPTTTPAVSAAPTVTIPRAYAKEETAAKPSRSVIAIRRTGIGIVRVVTPIASRGTVVHGSGNHCWANSDTNSHLSLCCRSRPSRADNPSRTRGLRQGRDRR